MSAQLFTFDLVLTALLLVKVWNQGLVPRYPAFAAALAFALVSGVALRMTPVQTKSYALIYAASQLGDWVLRYFVLRELSLQILNDHRGIREAVRSGMWVSLGLATLIPCGVAVFMRANPNSRFPWLEAYFLLHQSVSAFFAFLVLGTLLFLAWFPIRLRRNLVIYCVGYSVQFLAQAGAMLANNLASTESIRNLAGLSYQIVGLCINLVWLVWLSRAGEVPMVSVGHRWNEAAGDNSMRQLNDLNATLANVLRRNR